MGQSNYNLTRKRGGCFRSVRLPRQRTRCKHRRGDKEGFKDRQQPALLRGTWRKPSSGRCPFEMAPREGDIDFVHGSSYRRHGKIHKPAEPDAMFRYVNLDTGGKTSIKKNGIRLCKEGKERYQAAQGKATPLRPLFRGERPVNDKPTLVTFVEAFVYRTAKSDQKNCR